MKAMIFAAGFGKRLQPLTFDTPKPLIKIQGIPIIEQIIHYLVGFGITDIIINTHHLHSKLEEFFSRNSFGATITLRYEKQILGTGGGLYNTKDFWNDDDFMVCNSDILCTADLAEFKSKHLQSDGLVTLATNHRSSASMLLVDEEDYLVGLKREDNLTILQAPKGKTRPVGFCGYHLLSPKTFSFFSPTVAFSIIDEYMKLLGKQVKIKTWDIGDVFWEDIGTKEALEKANRHFPGFF
ncbi:NTP transferase domain-containing protein [bacterium]|nr:NTP transferase domain-containing protein [bacterium]